MAGGFQLRSAAAQAGWGRREGAFHVGWVGGVGTQAYVRLMMAHG